MLSALVVVSFFGFAVFMVGRIAPLYLEYRSVVATLTQAASAGVTDTASLRAQIRRGFDSGNVHTVSAEDVDVLTDPANAKLDIAYDAVAPFIGNVGIVIHFHAVAPVRAAGAP